MVGLGPTPKRLNGRVNSHFLPDEWIDRRAPVDDLEPIVLESDKLRESRLKCVCLINAAFSHIEAALLRPGATLTDIAVAFYQPAYALGCNICDGLSMTERADFWGVERASISKGATAFCSGNGLPASFYMKKEASQQSYRAARIKSIKKANRGPK